MECGVLKQAHTVVVADVRDNVSGVFKLIHLHQGGSADLFVKLLQLVLGAQLLVAKNVLNFVLLYLFLRLYGFLG